MARQLTTEFTGAGEEKARAMCWVDREQVHALETREREDVLYSMAFTEGAGTAL